MKKIYPLFGILGPVIYLLAVFIGGALRHDYSPFYNTISELSMAGAPNKILMDALFGIYNIFILIFGVGAYLDSSIDNSKKCRTSTLMIVAAGILGLLVLIFTQDPRGATATFNGTLHIVLSGITAALTIILILLIGLSFRRFERLRIFSWYSFASSILIFIVGGVSAGAVAANSAYGGLFERITIFLFLIWTIIFSYVILRWN